MAFTDSADAVGPNIDATAGEGNAPSGPGPGAQGAPPGGGPILNALVRRGQGPQVSAPGPGDSANSQLLVMEALGYLKQAVPGLPSNSPMLRDVSRAINSLSRHVPQGAPSAGVQQTHMQDQIKEIAKNTLFQRLIAQQQPTPGLGPGHPAGPSPLGGGMAQAPMPSTPLPGA